MSLVWAHIIYPDHVVEQSWPPIRSRFSLSVPLSGCYIVLLVLIGQFGWSVSLHRSTAGRRKEARIASRKAEGADNRGDPRRRQSKKLYGRTASDEQHMATTIDRYRSDALGEIEKTNVKGKDVGWPDTSVVKVKQGKREMWWTKMRINNTLITIIYASMQ